MRIAGFVVLATALAGAAFLFGLYHGSIRSPLYHYLLVLKKTAFGETLEFNSAGRYVRTEDRASTPCPAQTARTMVAVVFGQSNAANHLGHRYVGVDGRVLNFFAGRCYVARDPLLGATGNMGSAWTLLGNKLIESGRYDSLLLVAIGTGNTSIAQWAREDLRDELAVRLRELASAGYAVTHFLWHQGEADSGKTSAANYRTDLATVIDLTRAAFPASAFWVALASACPGRPVDPRIREAQGSVIDPARRVYAGPDTDTLLALEERYDGCHFSKLGQERLAELWLRALDV